MKNETWREIYDCKRLNHYTTPFVGPFYGDRLPVGYRMTQKRKIIKGYNYYPSSLHLMLLHNAPTENTLVTALVSG